MGNVMNRVCCMESEPELKNNFLDSNYAYSSSSRKIPSSEILFNQDNNKNSLTDISKSKFSRNPSEFYYPIKNLGSGAIGRVMKVMHRSSGAVRSMKIIPLHNINKNYKKEDIILKISRLKQLDHPHIIKLYEYYIDDDYIYFVNHFCSSGDLSQQLLKYKKFDENVVKLLMFQIFSAILYLNNQGIYHENLKLENILIDSINRSSLSYVNPSTNLNKLSYFSQDKPKYISKTYREKSNEQNENGMASNRSNKTDIEQPNSQNLNYEIKLIDYGYREFLTQSKNDFEESIETIIYSSPEALKGNFNEKSDVWSCGVIMYILLTGELPFRGESQDKIKNCIFQGKINFNSLHYFGISKEATDLINKCICLDSTNRIKIIDALHHPFFQSDNLNDSFNNEIILSLSSNSNTNFNSESSSSVSNKKTSKLYDAIFFFMVYNYFDKKKIEKLKEVFINMDLDFDRKITKDDLLLASKSNWAKIGKIQINSINSQIEYDENGYSDFYNFLKAAINKEELLKENNLRLAFDYIDSDKTGKISIYKLKELLNEDIQNEIQNIKIINELNEEIQLNGNKILNFEEFQNLMS